MVCITYTLRSGKKVVETIELVDNRGIENKGVKKGGSEEFDV